MSEPTRDEAFALLSEYNSNERLVHHGLCVESVMRYSARKRGYEEEKWGIIGLIHDLDYEKYPQQHCAKTAEILRSRGWPEDYIHAVVSHGWGICTDVEPLHEMEKVLFTIDELTGLVVATVLVRPSRSILDTKVSSVRKKWKDKRFAAGVDRSIIEKGAVMLGEELSSVIEETILGMREAAEVLDLVGTPSAEG